MNFDQVLELVRTVSDSELTSFQYEEGNQRITMQAGGVLFSAGMGGSDGCREADREAIAQGTTAFQGAVPIQKQTALEDTVSAGNRAENHASSRPAGKVVTSPLVGRFYTAPSEEAADFVKVGDTVKKGQVLAIVEAMKLMNEIESDYDGTVTEILAENGSGVEYGQPLFCIG